MNKRLFLAPGLVAVTLLAMSGACSQHDPGAYEGGGRTAPTTVIGIVTGNGEPPEGGLPEGSFIGDVYIPDTFVAPDTGGGD